LVNPRRLTSSASVVVVEILTVVGNGFSEDAIELVEWVDVVVDVVDVFGADFSVVFSSKTGFWATTLRRTGFKDPTLSRTGFSVDVLLLDSVVVVIVELKFLLSLIWRCRSRLRSSSIPRDLDPLAPPPVTVELPPPAAPRLFSL
jgi:hypothetical protein